jgi:hypothetical protein
MHATCHAHLLFLDFITLDTACRGVQIAKILIMQFSAAFFTYSILGQHILFSLSVRFFPYVTDQLLYKNTVKIIIVYISLFTFIDSK